MSKCRIINGRRVCGRKKSNNPFKMWGSWIGLIFYILLLVLASLTKPSNLDIGLGISFNTSGGIFFTIVNFLSFPFVLISPLFGRSLYLFGLFYLIGFPLTGFLLGWIITILWRKFRK